MLKGYGFLSLAKNFRIKYKKQLLDTGLDALETASKKAIHKAAEGSKIADKIVKPKHVTDENSRNVEEIVVPTEKREEILHKLR